MASSEKTVIGFAKQVAKDTPNVTDNLFKYLLFKEGGLAVANMNLPLDPEVGGGSMERNIVKAGVISGGALSIIPRPDTLGMLFMGILGKDVVVHDVPNSVYNHTFTHPTDEFDAPWFTGRQAPALMWGEQYPDMRMSSLVLSWRAARFVEAEIGLLGAGVPSKVASLVAWTPSTYLDNGPQFLSPLGTIELPTGTKAQVTSGAFAASLVQPVEDKMIVGSYSPATLDIIRRNYILSLVVRIEDGDLYTKMQLDPNGGSEWVADLMRNADIKLEFKSPVDAGGTGVDEAYVGVPYSFSIAANGETDQTANLVWTARPLSFRAGRQVTMAVTGTFLANTKAGKEPVTIKLCNTTPTY